MNQAQEAARQTIDRFRPTLSDSPSAAESDTSLAPQPVRSLNAAELSESGEPSGSAAAPWRFLRPPGAALPWRTRNPNEPLEPENEADPRCHECARCVDACPAHAIELNVYAQANASDAPTIVGPYIDARRQPCVLCEGLLCTHVCPSGALRPLTDPRQVKMGMAIVNQSTCRRASGDDCSACIAICPMGSSAIGLDGDRRIVVRLGCTGCGLCEQACPNEPASIFVQPAKA